VALQARNALTGEKTLLKATDGAVTLELVAREPCLVTRVGE